MKVELYVTDVRLDIDKHKFWQALENYSDMPNEIAVEVYREANFFPVYSKEPVERFELWDVEGKNPVKLKILTSKLYCMRKVYETLSDALDCDDFTVKKKASAISWEVFIMKNYGRDGMEFVDRVRSVDIYKRKLSVNKLNPLLRDWITKLF